MRRRLAGVAIAVAAATPAAWSQQAPVFRAAVDLVTVDATVVDGEGRPIEGLGPDDFVLKVDGQLRRVVAVQFVSREPAGIDVATGTTPTSRASSNAAVADGRLVLVAVDRRNIRRLEGRQALRAAERFIDALGPSDRVAVAGIHDVDDIEFSRDRGGAKRQLAALTGEAVAALIQPTFHLGLTESLLIADGNKSRLEAAVRRECGESLGRINTPARSVGNDSVSRNPCPTQLEQEARMTAQQVRTEAALSLDALIALIGRLETIEGPKTVALLSEGLVAEPRFVDLSPLAAAAAAARVSIYVLQLETPLADVATQQLSPTLVEDAQLRSDGLSRLAGVAGGTLFRLAGSGPGPFARILRELSGYYLLAFEATPSDRDGQSHRIDIEAIGRAGGATLRSRQAFRFEAPGPARARLERRLVELLRASNVAAELPLRVVSYSFYEPASRQVRIAIAAETEPDAGQPPQVLFGYVLIDAKGVIAASQVRDTATGQLTALALVPPGHYTLKVAAIDRYGRAGSLPRSVLAGVSDTVLPTSELMVARVNTDPSALADPIVDRTRDDRVLAYLELYPPAGRSLRDVDVTFTVRSPSQGDALLSMPAAIVTRGDGHAAAQAVLPVQRLPPGRYIVRAEVVDAGTRVGFVERALAIDRK
jgi:VWFA-related protein